MAAVAANVRPARHYQSCHPTTHTQSRHDAYDLKEKDAPAMNGLDMHTLKQNVCQHAN